jgi:hypothetical protein
VDKVDSDYIHQGNKDNFDNCAYWFYKRGFDMDRYFNFGSTFAFAPPPTKKKFKQKKSTKRKKNGNISDEKLFH